MLAYIPVKDLKDEEYVNGNYVILCTKKGLIKKKQASRRTAVRAPTASTP